MGALQISIVVLLVLLVLVFVQSGRLSSRKASKRDWWSLVNCCSWSGSGR